MIIVIVVVIVVVVIVIIIVVATGSCFTGKITDSTISADASRAALAGARARCISRLAGRCDERSVRQTLAESLEIVAGKTCAARTAGAASRGILAHTGIGG